MDLALAMTAVDKVGNHTAPERARSVQGHQRYQVFEPLGFQFSDKIRHTARFHLEYACCLTMRKHITSQLVIKRDRIDIDRDTATFFDQFDRMPDNSQRTKTQEVHLEKSDLFYLILIVLRRVESIRTDLYRYIVGQLLFGDHDTCRMCPRVTRKAFDRPC